MATSRTFQDMLNEYLPNKLLEEELTKRDYFLKNLEKDNNWKGGTLIVPFRGARASTVKFGELAAQADINQSVYVRGEISDQPELWGSLIFNERDLMEHDKLSEQNFLKLLPDEIEDFMGIMKNAVSMTFTNGEVLATATADGTVGGLLEVDRVERFEVGQPIQIQDDDTAAAKYWVAAVNINTNIITVSASITLSPVADISAYTVAQNAVVYLDGNQTAGNRLTSLRGSLLSAANGGETTLYGQTKTDYPYLQAINVDGSSVTASNVLEKIFDLQTDLRNKGKGMADKAIVSYKHLGSILKSLQSEKGAFRQHSDLKANQYGWSEIEVSGVRGMLTIVAIQEMDDDVIYVMDLSAAKVYSNGFFRKRKDPGDQKEYFTVRATTGYQYICDMCFFGDIVLQRPSRCAVLHSISY